MATAKQKVSDLIDSVNKDDYLKAKSDLQDIVTKKIAATIADKSYDLLQKEFKGTDVSDS